MIKKQGPRPSTSFATEELEGAKILLCSSKFTKIKFCICRSHEFGRLDALHPYFTDGITETQKGCMHSGSKEWLRLFRLFFLVQTTGTQEIKESA
ncbi:hypothetical protein Y1Q_0024564 [Alligator mississippiensis]|uniref:Uncharacterized protein n=1 Tax=Alligator mississippiensis TaxID=8496 RepID=A0A151NBF2_ALLMI|nr:hypothetical protein Y1Q_0024564 [Alligator mississippiensis]